VPVDFSWGPLVLQYLFEVFISLVRVTGGQTAALSQQILASETTVTGVIGKQLDDLAVLIDELELDISPELDAQTILLKTFQEGETSRLTAILNAALKGLGIDARISTDRILAAISTNTRDVNTAADRRASQIEQEIRESTGATNTKITDMQETVVSILGEERGILESVWDFLQMDIREVLNVAIEIGDGIFDSLVNKVGGVVGTVIDKLSIPFFEHLGVWKDVVEEQLELFLEWLLPDAEHQAEVIEIMKDDNAKTTEVVEAVLDPTNGGLGATVNESASTAQAKRWNATAGDLSLATRSLTDPIMTDSLTMECDLMDEVGESTHQRIYQSYIDRGWSEDAARDKADNDLGSSILDVALAGINLLALPLGLAALNVKPCLAVWSESNPHELIPAGDAIRMFFLGQLTEDETLKILMRHGFARADSKRMIWSAQRIPDVENLLALWLRESLDDDAIDFALSQLGFNPEYAAGMKELAYFIPPVQDLITMAVREVFSPDIRQAQRQDEDYPEDFNEWAGKQGVSEEWAKNYWAAHWSLPSPQMGFEMLHRGVITETELGTLLRALDVMPGWRQALIDISYSPYTRVDIRRMHKVGVLSDAEVKQSYQDIGYNPDRAQKLLEFTKELNKDEGYLTFDVASDLTRGHILQFYKRGIISEAVALLYLGMIGINAAASKLFIENIDYEIELKKRDQDTDLILDRYRYELAGYDKTEQDLRDLNLSYRETEEAIHDLRRLQDRRNKTPSKADLDKFLKASLITSVEYTEMLEQMGYSPYWSEKYLALIEDAPEK